MAELLVIGGGLAGSEAAWQAGQLGMKVSLFEMRPNVPTGAHTGPYLGELVCSNSLGSKLVDRASGLLKEEVRQMGSLLLDCAGKTEVPAGGALAVDREAFARMVTDNIKRHPNIRIIREEITEIPDQPAIIATGPLTSPSLSSAISILTGREHLYFYDAIAPVVTLDSINFDIAFRASRYDRGELKEGDYINCPLGQLEYESFIDALLAADRIVLREFESDISQGVRAGANRFFESCLPIEVIACRGRETLAFGPMRPVGLKDPRTGQRPYAVVQLRQDDLAGTIYNMVGFQTNLKYSEQKKVFQLIPGLEKAEFVRFGQMHRNTFIFSPAHLKPTLQFREREDLFFAGQVTGVEGYIGNIATGLLAGRNAVRTLSGQESLVFPRSTMLGALCHYITHASPADFQPMKANYGILPPLDTRIRGKRERAKAYSMRALEELDKYLKENNWIYI